MKNMPLSSRIIFVFLVLCPFACKEHQAGIKSSSDLASVEQTFAQINQEWMYGLRKGDSVALGNLYSTDAKLMGSGPSIVGREEITKDLGRLIRAGVNGIKYKSVGLWGSDSLYVQEFVESFYYKDGKEADHGKSIIVWKMEKGKWNIFRDMYDSDEPIKKGD